ncbi:hypothetical protein G5714_021111 [Onychostoma macrolepis]|uniref:Uncharacterized protein n=1 Tax=Onychostoma macrolepis TaxID=369639 RepID=A0A7J6BRK6_9TELE|nr:hypothetical protein G5714_021111 [Onychostoma macrolepis]
MVWTCGGMAYYHLDQGDWRGCCYPALLSTGTTVLTEKDIERKDVELERSRKRRDISSMPIRYNGYKTVSPWTKPWENVGWSLADNSDNITNIVEHMKESIPEPEKVDPSWFSWLNTLWVDGELGSSTLLYLLEFCV